MERSGKILVVDDDPLVLEALFQTFMDDYQVVSAPSGEEAIRAVTEQGDIETIVLDMSEFRRLDGGLS